MYTWLSKAEQSVFSSKPHSLDQRILGMGDVIAIQSDPSRLSFETTTGKGMQAELLPIPTTV